MVNDEDMQKLLEAACGDNQRKWAKKHKFSPQYVNQVMNGKKPMSERMAKILGYKKVVDWQPRAKK